MSKPKHFERWKHALPPYLGPKTLNPMIDLRQTSRIRRKLQKIVWKKNCAYYYVNAPDAQNSDVLPGESEKYSQPEKPSTVGATSVGNFTYGMYILKFFKSSLSQETDNCLI